SSVFTTKYFGGANIALGSNRFVNQKNPQLGFGYNIGASYLVNLEETDRAFLNLKADARIVLPVTKGLIFAHRTGAATNAGDFEFYQANTIGGLDKMRGYWRTRFTGKTSFYQNTELRWELAKLKGYVFRGVLGIYGFFDDGRVWVKNDQSGTLHTSYGGGIYFIPFNLVALNLTYGISKEANVFTVRTGFLF
ncbi:MAG TPA: hypothetical protein VLR49_06610, partial [Ferruginibacter sp.]|nr:hypothetical protein [Ferruginibacter sp.]